MKKSLAYFSLVLVCISVFNSCEDEPVQLNEWTQLKHGTNDFIKRESISNYPEILSYAEDLAKPKYRESTRTEDQNATFSILEHINAYIFTDSLATTYTIPILKTNQTEFGFSNLVIKYEGDNPVKEFILNYVPTQNYLSNYVDYNQTPFEGTVTYESIINETEGQRSARMSCSTVWVTYCDWSEGFEHGEVHYAGPNCHQSAFMWPGREVVCEDEPGTYTITPNPEGGGGGFIPGVDTDDDDDDPHTTPVPPDICTTAMGGIIGIANNDGCIEPNNTEDECVANLNSVLDLGYEVESCLTSSENNIDICNIESEVLDFIFDETDNFTNEEAILIGKEFFDILCELPDAKFIRFKELKEILKDNPWALIENCAEQNGLDTSDYLNLYNLPFPEECSSRLNLLSTLTGTGSTPPYRHQPITAGNVPLANIDYYGVEVTSYPDFNNDGIDDSEAEIYQAFREKFIDIASGEVDDFQFSCNIPGNPTNTADITWEFVPLFDSDASDFISNDPIASIMLIESEAEGLLPSIANDEGAVIVSEFTNNDWTISTITTQFNGTQPFSGNRQWGWLINNNGNLEFFTRAVDVARISKIFNVAPGTDTECQQDSYYGIAEATWDNMQQEIKDWINSPESNGGQASIIPKTAIRVDKSKIEELLKSNQTIEEINCD